MMALRSLFSLLLLTAAISAAISAGSAVTAAALVRFVRFQREGLYSRPASCFFCGSRKAPHVPPKEQAKTHRKYE